MSVEVLQIHNVATANRAVSISQYTDVTVISNWHSPGLSTLCKMLLSGNDIHLTIHTLRVNKLAPAKEGLVYFNMS